MLWNSVRQATIWVIGLVLAAYFVFTLVGIHHFGMDEPGLIDSIRGNESNDKYRRTMEWATGLDAQGNENIPAGERIFNCNWDDFPKLFFLDQKHSYVYGLDPNYLYTQNPDLYKQLQDITNAKVDDAGPIIREKFGARFIFADAKENDDMVAKGLDSGWMEVVYEDDEGRILKIRDQKGQPPILMNRKQRKKNGSSMKKRRRQIKRPLTTTTKTTTMTRGISPRSKTR